MKKEGTCSKCGKVYSADWIYEGAFNFLNSCPSCAFMDRAKLYATDSSYREMKNKEYSDLNEKINRASDFLMSDFDKLTKK